MKHTTLVAGAITSLVALGLAGNAGAADAPKMEKCYGIVKAGKNDCQTSNTACAGTAKKDSQKDAWIYIPQGTCDKIVGGSTKTGK
jgi:uncharacterized membrane protein